MLPGLELLEQIQQQILSFPNQRKESKRKEHHGLFLLGYKAGLRVSEAISFDLANKTRKGLYSVKSKGKKERFVYIPAEVINELKKHNWKPNNTNRFNFYHFLKRVKRELRISKSIELTPHTLRRAFATYYAEAGLPLPLLQKLLGHQSIRTTALYWQNIYGEDDNNGDILAVKEWLTKPKKPKPIPENPIQISLEQLPEPLTLNPLISEPLPNYLSKIKDLEHELSQISQENKHLKVELIREKEQNTDLHQDLNNLTKQNTNLYQAKNQAISENHQLQQNLTQAQETIQQLTQQLTHEQSKRIQAENNLIFEKRAIADLNHQLQTERKTNTNLTQKLVQQEQNHANLISTYQKTLKDKEQISQTEKSRIDYYENQLKAIAKTLYQWQKTNYYQKLEQQSEIQTQIIQPPPWKPK